MAIDFPSSPSSGQQHSHNDSLWEWDGSSWNRVGALINTNASQLVGIAVTQFARRDIDNIITGVTTFIGNGYTGVGNTVLIVEGDARVTGVLSIGQGSVSINERDISAVGVVTASSFVGNITGDVTNTSGVSTAKVVSGGINLHNFGTSGHTFIRCKSEGNVDTNIIRITTSNNDSNANAAYGFNIKYRGAGSGNNNYLSFYGDNQTGTEVEGLRIYQNGIVQSTSSAGFYAGANLKLRASGNDSYIEELGSGNLFVKADDLVLNNAAGSQFHARFHNGGKSEFGFNGSTRIETTSTGVSITGNSVVSGNVTGVAATFTGNVTVGGVLTYEDVKNVDSVGVITARSGIRLGATGANTLITGDANGATITSNVHDGGLSIVPGNNNQESRINLQGKASNGTLHAWSIGASRSADRFYVSNTSNTLLAILDNGNVGIGIGDPDSLLHLKSASSPTIHLEDTSQTTKLKLYAQDASGVVGTYSNHPLILTANSAAEALRITSAGQVQINRDGGSAALTLGASQDFKLWHDAGGPTIFSDTGNQGLKLQIKELNLTEYTGTTTKLKIDSSGRLLIGTTTEGHTSADDITIYSSGHAGMTIRSGTSSAGSIYFSDATSGGDEYNGYIIYDQSNDSLRFGTNEGDRLYITSVGKVGINSTSPADLLTIGAGANTLAFGAKDTTRGNHIWQLLNNDASGNAEFRMYKNSVSGTHAQSINFATSGDHNYILDGNFGLGTSTIRERFHIHKTDSHEAYLRFTNTGTGTGADDGFNIGINSVEQALIWNKENTDMLFGTHGSTRMTIDSGGTTRLQRSTYNTGAVTASNAALYLDIGSTEGAVNINQLIGFGYRNATTSAKPAYIGYQATTWSGHTRGDLIFGTRDTTTATDEATERLRITHDGQVGICTQTIPSDAAVHIGLTGAREYLRLDADNGGTNAYIELQANNNRRKAIIFKSGGTRRGVIGVGDSDEAANATSLFFSASDKIGGDSPHMVIDSSGKMGLGTGSPTSLFHMQGAAPRITLMDTGGSNDYAKIFSTGGALYLQQRDDSAHGNIIFRTEDNSGAQEKLRITGDKVMFTADAKVDTNNSRDLGASGARWKRGYFGTGLIVTGVDSGTVDGIIITNTSTTNNGLSIGVASDEKAFLWNGSDTNMNFATDNKQHMTLTSTGQLGIGTNFTPSSSTSKRLTVLCDAVGDGIHIANKENLYSAASTGYSDIRFSFYDYATGGHTAGGESIIRGYSRNAYTNNRTTDLIFMTSSDDGDPSSGTATEKLRITSAGNLALGNDGSFPIYTDTNDRNFILGTGSDDAAMHLHSGTDKYGGIYYGDATSGSARWSGYIEYKHGTNDNFMRFATNETERLRIDKNGRMRLGNPTGTTVTDLDVVRANSTITDVMLVKGNAGNGFIRFQDSDVSCNWTVGVDDGSGIGANGFIWYDRINGAYRLSLDNDGDLRVWSGKLGVGVDPTEKLHVQQNHNGHTRAVIQNNWGANATAQLKLISPTDEFAFVKYASGDAHITLSNAANIKINVGGTEQMRINDTNVEVRNNLYIGGGISAFDGGRIHTSGSGTIYGFTAQHSTQVIFTNEQGGTSQAMTLADTSNGTNTSVLWGVSVKDSSNSPTTGSSGWSQKIRVEGNGDLVHSGSHSASGSDDRLKKNKVGITSALTKVCGMEGFIYEWNDVAEKIGMGDGDKHFGLSAQTVKPLAPEVVVINDSLVNPDDGTNDYMTIRYEKLVPLLVEAIKDLKAEVDALKSS